MIDDARHIPGGTQLDCDVCIVGGGPAGISIAHELDGSGLKVLLLEGGGKTESAQSRDMHRGLVSPASSHERLEKYRRRQFGGSTVAWGGRCVPFDAIDFEKREWVPHSGWPFSKSELDPFYARAMALCEAGRYACTTEEALPGTPREMIAGFDGREVVTNRLERWGPPTHFGKRYAQKLRASGNVTVLLHANALRVRLDSAGSRVEGVEAATFADSRFTVRPRVCILAGGTLETTRLMLASEPERGGIGNHSDKLGRYYMSHLLGSAAVVRVRETRTGFMYGFEKDADGVYVRRRFWITPDTQREHRMLNAVAFLFRPPLSEAEHGSAVLSAAYLSKFFLRLFKRRAFRESCALLQKNRASLLAHSRNIILGAPGLVPKFAAIAQQRFLAKRRLPFVLPPQKGNAFHLFFQTEHAPNPDSRVTLHPTEKDALGMPRLLVDIRFTEQDVETVIEEHRILKRRFEESGTGTLEYDESELRAHVKNYIRDFDSSSHHLGTTRMSPDPREGVVDPDCRVHGVGNLFIASGSVCPTAGHANPTLTFVALALRIADHVKRTLRETGSR